mgnify:CR=1 FL=1
MTLRELLAQWRGDIAEAKVWLADWWSKLSGFEILDLTVGQGLFTIFCLFVGIPLGVGAFITIMDIYDKWWGQRHY